MRYAEAETGMGYERDFDRKLTAQGISKLHRLNKVLTEKNIQYDLLIKSPAQRTMQTAQVISAGLPVAEELVKTTVYESSLEKLLEIILALPDPLEHVLLVGHNPSISALLMYLADDFNVSLTTGMMAVLTFDLPAWNMITKGSGSLSEVLQ